MEEGGPSFGKFFFGNVPSRDSFFLKSEKGHIGVIPHPHTIMGTRGEGQGRWGRSVEVGGGDLGGGRVRGGLAPFVLNFPQPLAFFGFSPLNFLIKAKCTNEEKGPKVEDMTPFDTSCARPPGRWT